MEFNIGLIFEMETNRIQKSVRKWVSKYHKATEEIRQNVFDDLGQSVSNKAFSTALLGLHSTGIVTSHIYDNQSENYAQITSPDEYSIDVLYWLATQEAE